MQRILEVEVFLGGVEEGEEGSRIALFGVEGEEVVVYGRIAFLHQR